MTKKNEIPTLDDIKGNLLDVRNHTHFNIGSPQAIDHLLISLVAIIDAIQATPQTTPIHRMGRGPIRDTTNMRTAQRKRRERERTAQRKRRERESADNLPTPPQDREATKP